MLVSIQSIEMGQVFKDRSGQYLQKTIYPLVTGDVLCISKEGVYDILPSDIKVETDIPWTEQPDGYKILYEYIKSIYPIKTQEIYNQIKEKQNEDNN